MQRQGGSCRFLDHGATSHKCVGTHATSSQTSLCHGCLRCAITVGTATLGCFEDIVRHHHLIGQWHARCFPVMVFGRSDDSHAVLQRVSLDLSDFTLPHTPTDSIIVTSATPQFFLRGSKVMIAVGRVVSPLEPLPRFHQESGLSRSAWSCSGGTQSWHNGVVPIFTKVR